MARESSRAALPPTVVALGVVSLLTDISSEMIFPLLPAFLAARVSGAPLVLGAMEGVAELISSALKYVSGRWADRVPRLKPLVMAGYGLSAAARPLMALVTQWWQPLLIRSADRVGKGVRTSPRDAMISHWVPEGARARAFGFHRAMDHGGAALGAGLALALAWAGMAVEHIFLASAIPGALAVAAVAFAREPLRPVPQAGGAAALEPVPRRLWSYLVPVTIFGLANATDGFLLLLLTEQGAAAPLLPLAWLVLQAVKSIASFPGGWVADRLGPAKVVLAGWSLYALSYGALAFSPGVGFTFGAIAFYGLYHALAEGAEKAVLVGLTPAAARGRAFGLYHGLTGGASLAAGLLFGALWSGWGSKAAFLTAGGIAAGSALLLLVLLPRLRAGASSSG